MVRSLSILSLSLLFAVPGVGLYDCGGEVTDADGDGYPADIDCDDNDPSIHPDQDEPCICDEIDQNCNGVVDDFPCDISCPDPGQVGDVCGGEEPSCAEGLVCCYPCGIPDCDFICQEPCDEGEPWCESGCALVP